jgi:hypothetical protein
MVLPLFTDEETAPSVFGGIGVWIQGFTLVKQALYCLSHTSSPFCHSYFGDGGVSWTICPGWPWTVILLLSASQVARITDLATSVWLEAVCWQLKWDLNLGLWLKNKYFHYCITAASFLSRSEFFVFSQYWSLNSCPTPWTIPPVLFCEGFYQDRVSWTFCSGWLWTTSLLLSAS